LVGLPELFFQVPALAHVEDASAHGEHSVLGVADHASAAVQVSDLSVGQHETVLELAELSDAPRLLGRLLDPPAVFGVQHGDIARVSPGDPICCRPEDAWSVLVPGDAVARCIPGEGGDAARRQSLLEASLALA